MFDITSRPCWKVSILSNFTDSQFASTAREGHSKRLALQRDLHYTCKCFGHMSKASTSIDIYSLYYVCVIFLCILSHTYTFPHSTYESSSSLSFFFNLTSILRLLSSKSQKLEFRESGFKAMSWNYNSWDQNWRQSQWKSDDQWNEGKSNASSAWDWQQPKRQSEADWSTSTPKKLRTENYQWVHQ